jgi:hypothetical protein
VYAGVAGKQLCQGGAAEQAYLDCTAAGNSLILQETGEYLLCIL